MTSSLLTMGGMDKPYYTNTGITTNKSTTVQSSIKTINDFNDKLSKSATDEGAKHISLPGRTGYSNLDEALKKLEKTTSTYTSQGLNNVGQSISRTADTAIGNSSHDWSNSPWGGINESSVRGIQSVGNGLSKVSPVAGRIAGGAVSGGASAVVSVAADGAISSFEGEDSKRADVNSSVGEGVVVGVAIGVALAIPGVNLGVGAAIVVGVAAAYINDGLRKMFPQVASFEDNLGAEINQKLHGVGDVIYGTGEFIGGAARNIGNFAKILWDSEAGDPLGALESAKARLQSILKINENTSDDMTDRYNTNVNNAIYSWDWILSESEIKSEISNRNLHPSEHYTPGKVSEVTAKIQNEIKQIDDFISALKSTLTSAQSKDIEDAGKFK